MKLIDADLLTSTTELSDKILIMDTIPYISLFDLIDYIDNMPTAYDIEKVKHQLRCNTFKSGISAVINFDDVMKIVEKGRC